MARPRRKSNKYSQLFDYFDSNLSLGWRRINGISYDDGERLTRMGTARRVNDCNGIHVGYQACAEKPMRNGGVSKPTPAMLTRREMDLIAGQKFPGGQSKTLGLSEEKRLSRLHPVTKKLLPAEDAIERAVAKLDSFQPRFHVVVQPRVPPQPTPRP